MTENLKIEVSMVDVEGGVVDTTLATKEELNEAVQSKADLIEGKVPVIQLPTFQEINGVSEAINGVETKIREEVETKLSNSNNGLESRIDEKLVLKADLVNGRVPASQSPAFKDVEGAKGALDGLKEALTTKYDQKVVELSEGKADLVDGKIPTSQLPIDGIVTPLQFQLKSKELDTKFTNLEYSIKSEKNAFITQAGNLISGKANAVDVYNKVTVDIKLNGKVDKSLYVGEIVKKADQTYVDAAIGAINTDASKQYATLDLANADIANIALNKNIFVSESANGGYWYKATSGATSLTKSDFDPLSSSKNYTDQKTAFWQVSNINVQMFDPWSPYAVGFVGLNGKMPLGIRKDGVVVAQKMVTEDLETSSQIISNIKLQKLDPFTGFVFGIGNGRKYPLLIDTLGAVHSEKIKVNSLEVNGVEIGQNTEKYSHVTQEWWIYPVHVYQSKPYPRVLSGMYSERGEIVIGEYVIGTGVINQFVIGSTPLIDDHNAPSVCAVDGKRTIVTWTRHDATNMIYMKYSSGDGDIRTLEYSELFEIDCGTRVTYTQAHFIESRSTDEHDIYWIFYRANSTRDWRIAELKFVGESFEVLRHIPLLRAGGQYYISTSLSDNILRIASGYNPAHPTNTMHYFEVSTITGEIKGMDGVVLGNTDQVDTLPVITTSVPPVLPQTDAGKDRRLHYVRPAPASPAIAYAEWDLTDTDNATYKVVSLENGEWVIRDVAQAGKRFGYTPEANYISGISFPDPCFKDEVLISRYDNESDEGVLERAFLVNGAYVKKESARASGEHFLRPISPKEGGNICLYTHLYEYGKTSTFSFVSDIKLIFMK